MNKTRPTGTHRFLLLYAIGCVIAIFTVCTLNKLSGKALLQIMEVSSTDLTTTSLAFPKNSIKCGLHILNFKVKI